MSYLNKPIDRSGWCTNEQLNGALDIVRDPHNKHQRAVALSMLSMCRWAIKLGNDIEDWQAFMREYAPSVDHQVQTLRNAAQIARNAEATHIKVRISDLEELLYDAIMARTLRALTIQFMPAGALGLERDDGQPRRETKPATEYSETQPDIPDH